MARIARRQIASRRSRGRAARASRRRGASASPRGCAAEVDRGEIEIGQRHQLHFVEADALQILDELRRVADQHDRQPRRLQVLLRDALDVVGRDRRHALAIGLQLLQIEVVEQRVQHLHRDRVGRLDGQREVAGEIRLRARELAVADALALQLRELVDHDAQRFGGRLGARVGLGDDAARPLVGVHVGRGAVGQAALVTQHALQSDCRLRRRECSSSRSAAGSRGDCAESPAARRESRSAPRSDDRRRPRAASAPADRPRPRAAEARPSSASRRTRASRRRWLLPSRDRRPPRGCSCSARNTS